MSEVSKLAKDTLGFGDLLLIASKSHGKTETLKALAREFKSLPDTRVFIFEDFPKWCKEFDSIAYTIIKDNDVRDSEHTIDVSDYFLRHEKSYTIARSDLIKFLEENKHGIFVSEIKDIDRTAFFIYSVVNYFYRKAYLREYKDYGKKENIVFIVEESQNVFDSSTINKKLFNRMRKIFSVARNLHLHFVLCSQRLQDLNTKVRSRCKLLVGQVSLDDYELKFERLLRHSKYRKNVLNLPKGVFLYPSLDTLISFPLFKQSGKPYLWKPKPETEMESYTFKGESKKEGFFKRLMNRLKPRQVVYTEKDYTCPNCGLPCSKLEYDSGFCLDCDTIEMELDDYEGD